MTETRFPYVACYQPAPRKHIRSMEFWAVSMEAAQAHVDRLIDRGELGREARLRDLAEARNHDGSWRYEPVTGRSRRPLGRREESDAAY